MGQSRISMQLAQLKQAGLVEVRRAGQKSLYRMADLQPATAMLIELLREAGKEIAEAAQDDRGLRLILDKRKDKLRGYFDELAGRFGRNYVPGRSWKGLAEMFLKLMPPLVVADLGAGEGTLSLLLTQRAERVIAVDNSPEDGRVCARRRAAERGEEPRVPAGRSGRASNRGCRSGPRTAAPESPPRDASEKAIEEAWRIVKPGGRVVVMDLVKHRFEEAREMYADVWLGFSEVELVDMLQHAGFRSVGGFRSAPRGRGAAFRETMLAIGERPA